MANIRNTKVLYEILINMVKTIKINDTLRITEEQGFPAFLTQGLLVH